MVESPCIAFAHIYSFIAKHEFCYTWRAMSSEILLIYDTILFHYILFVNISNQIRLFKPKDKSAAAPSERFILPITTKKYCARTLDSATAAIITTNVKFFIRTWKATIYCQIETISHVLEFQHGRNDRAKWKYKRSDAVYCEFRNF